MDRLKKSALPFLILLAFLSLVIGFRSFLMAYIIGPIALLLWAFWRIVSSVDQNIYWMVLIVLCLFLVLRLIPSGKDKSNNSAYVDTPKSLNRVEYWQTVFRDADLGRSESEQLRNGLKELLLATIAQDERTDLSETEAMIAVERASLSPEARRFLFPSSLKRGASSTNDAPNQAFSIPKRLRKWTSKFIHQDRALVGEILSWMEADLEINPELEIKDER